MKRKGVSPVVAVVLLIVVAISMGILVTTWVTHWISTQTSSSSISCAINTNYVIESAEFNETGDNILRLRLLNKGSQELYGFGAVLDNGTHIIRMNSTHPALGGNSTNNTLSEATALQREETVYFLVNLTNSTLGYPALGATLEEVRVLNGACDAVSVKTNTIKKYNIGG